MPMPKRKDAQIKVRIEGILQRYPDISRYQAAPDAHRETLFSLSSFCAFL